MATREPKRSKGPRNSLGRQDTSSANSTGLGRTRATNQEPSDASPELLSTAEALVCVLCPRLAPLIRIVPSRTGIAAVILLSASGGLLAYWDASTARYLNCYIRTPFQVGPPGQRMSPPYEPAIFPVTHVPDDLQTNHVRVLLGNRYLDPNADEFSVSNPKHGRAELCVPLTVFGWAEPPGESIEIVIYYMEKERFRYRIPLAQRPRLRLRKGKHVRLLRASGVQALPKSEQVVAQFLTRANRFAVPVYLVGPGVIVVMLPKWSKKSRHAFGLMLDDKPVKIPAGTDTTVRLSALQDLGAATGACHVLCLTYLGRPVSKMLIIRYLAPLRELRAGQKWRPRKSVERYWDYDHEKDPDCIRAGGAVPPGIPGRQGFNGISFDHLAMSVEPGIFVLSAVFEGTSGGSLSMVFTGWFEAVIPRGPGWRQVAFKVARELGWCEAERETALNTCKRQDAEVVLGDPSTEIIFRVWSPELHLSDGAPHTATLVVRIRKARSSIDFELYIDSICVAKLARHVESLPVQFTPEIRHRGCVDLVFRDFEVLHLREPLGFASAVGEQSPGVLALGNAASEPGTSAPPVSPSTQSVRQ